MAQYWGDFPSSAAEDEIPDVLPAGRYVSVIPNGHGALTAWIAGPRRCYRTMHPATAHGPVRVTRGHPGKVPEEVWYEPFTEADLQQENDDINSYLAEAGIRPRPRGYKWHVLVPDNISDGKALEDALKEKNLYIDPAEVRKAIVRLYNALLHSHPPK
ncbi:MULTISPECIES: DUF5956 family protein [unclassified Rhodococcus (in: high G+C Gram-positive bacteria)]|uniref:DUF5956 family protein n=1 Tax=unclassified Rhodococcus (in: high G+C Gram-positive bacteria) TaxID=192944 RepID=UPI00117B4318|nr:MULTISPECIES: DUF5956 family protein [unclassified Rhodococcus (in: high G+C Gram-positive bacteria)]